ncbi:MAG: RNA-binding protein [Lachnospiraceae bacterium]|nr:RNA-binding protein [Lachnospiraceae bacterium]
MDTKKDELIFVRHMEELAKSAYYKGINIYSDFCTLAQQGLVAQQVFPVPYSFYGGFADAERIKVGFHGGLTGHKRIAPDEFKEDYPLCMVEIRPQNVKFAEELTHRDYLGAILNLGIDRSTTGDILPVLDAVYLCCDPMIGNFLCENLIRVRHTSVRVSICDQIPDTLKRPTDRIHANVASLRLDAVVGAAFHLSRGNMAGLISCGKVMVNGREVLQGSTAVKDGDVISVRGFGKFRYVGMEGTTKKGRLFITLEKYQ